MDNRPLITPNIYFAFALKCAIFISIIEAPVLFLGLAAAPIVYPAGWTFIFAYTFHRAWKLRCWFLMSNRPTVSKCIGGLILISMASRFLYYSVTMPSSVTMPLPEADNPLWRIKYAFILNALAGVDAAVIAILGTYLIGQIQGSRS